MTMQVMRMRTMVSRGSDVCPQCGNALLWWRSRTGQLVCIRCYPDPLDALSTLGWEQPTCWCILSEARIASPRGGCGAWESGGWVPAMTLFGGTLCSWDRSGCTGDPNYGSVYRSADISRL